MQISIELGKIYLHSVLIEDLLLPYGLIVGWKWFKLWFRLLLTIRWTTKGMSRSILNRLTSGESFGAHSVLVNRLALGNSLSTDPIIHRHMSGSLFDKGKPGIAIDSI